MKPLFLFLILIYGLNVFGQQTKKAVHTVQEVFNATTPPCFPGGDSALNAFIKNNLCYTQIAKDQEIEGRVIIRFMINEKGEIKDLKIVRDIGAGCGLAAINVFKAMPNGNLPFTKINR